MESPADFVLEERITVVVRRQRRRARALRALAAAAVLAAAAQLWPRVRGAQSVASNEAVEASGAEPKPGLSFDHAPRPF